MMNIRKLARKRITHNKSQTILTCIALILSTILLISVGNIAIGFTRANKAQVVASDWNFDANYRKISEQQVNALKHHKDIDALTTIENFANVEKDKIDALLSYTEVIVPGINGKKITSGNLPVLENEIVGQPVFFQRLGVEPEIGCPVEISYRIHGEGEIITKEFVISGLYEQEEIVSADIIDANISYSGTVSKALVEASSSGFDRDYRALVQVSNPDNLNFDGMEDRIKSIADDIGIPKSSVVINNFYVMWTNDPGTETVAAIAGISAIIVLFASFVIYGIYYVSIVTNIQELGKIRAMGATKTQMKHLLLCEGFTLAIISLPIGLLVGYFTSKLGLNMALDILSYNRASVTTIAVFSLPIVLFTICVILLTVYLSLRKPMKMASRISPIDAIRYQEAGGTKQSERKGHHSMNIKKLAGSTLRRNRKRTTCTILTIAMGCTLFITISCLLSSMNAADYARLHLPKGDFSLDYRYGANDETYPERNLDSLQKAEPFGSTFKQEILSISGVKAVENRETVLAYLQHPGFEAEKRYTIGAVSKEDMLELQANVERGVIDYDNLLENNGVVFTSDSYLEDMGLAIGDPIMILVVNGEDTIAIDCIIMASVGTGTAEFYIPKEIIDDLGLKTDTTSGLYIWSEDKKYDDVKSVLKEIAGDNNMLMLTSFDEQLAVSKNAMKTIKYAAYVVLVILCVVSFMNLINTLITSVMTRKVEIAMLQAIGLSNIGLLSMLSLEGLFIVLSSLAASLSFGGIFGYMCFLWAKNNQIMGISHFSYPITEALIMSAILLLSQLAISYFISRNLQRETLIERMRV